MSGQCFFGSIRAGGLKSVFSRDFCSYFVLPCFARARQKKAFFRLYAARHFGEGRVS